MPNTIRVEVSQSVCHLRTRKLLPWPMQPWERWLGVHQEHTDCITGRMSRYR